jgi:site-specific DNA-cytosine methylase
MKEVRHYCTCCNKKFYEKKMIEIEYNLLKKSFWHCQICVSAYADNLHTIVNKKSKYLIELFSGSKTVSSVAKNEFNYKTLTIDNEASYNPDICQDINTLKLTQISYKKQCSIIWASVPCYCFTILTLKTHWKKMIKAHRDYIYMPQTKEAWAAIRLLEKTLWLIKHINPTYYFIENPRGVMRHLPQTKHIPYIHSISYKDYGFSYEKPTDIFTNHPALQLKKLRRSDYETSKKDLQSLNSSYERSIVPIELVRSIISQCQ